MAVTLTQYDFGRDLSSVSNPSVTAAFTGGTPANGAAMGVVAGNYHKESSEDLSITTPATGYTQVVVPSDVVGEFLLRGFEDTYTTGDGTDVIAEASGAADPGMVIVAMEFAGSAGFDVGSSKIQSASTSCAIPATSAVAANGSLAVAVFFRVSTSEAVGTPSYSGGFTEIAKNQVNGTSIEIYFASLAVNAGATPACTLSGMASAQDMGGIIMVFGPITNTAPTITAPASKRMVAGVANTINGLSVADADDDALTIEIQCTSGTLSVATADASSAGVTITSGNGTNDLVLDGTVAQFTSLFAQAAGQGVKYTQPGYTDDTITFDANDGTVSGTQDTTTVTMWTAKVYGTTMAGVNATLATITIADDTAESFSITMVSEDGNGNTDTDTATVMVSVPPSGSVGEGVSHTKLSHTVGIHF